MSWPGLQHRRARFALTPGMNHPAARRPGSVVMPFLDPGLAVPSRRLSPAVAGRVPAAGRIAALAATRRVAALAATGIAPLAVAFSLAFAPAAAPAQVRPAVLPRPAAELDRAPMDSSTGTSPANCPTTES